MRRLAFLIPLLASCCFAQAQTPNNLSLIPQPVSLTLNEGVFKLDGNTVITVGNGASEKEAQLFADQINTYFSVPVQIVKNVKAGNSIALELSNDPNLPEDGYTLTIAKEKITISGKGAGVFYGLQSLLQIIPPGQTGPPYAVPCMSITDYPRFGWRGMHLDCARHFFSKSDVKRYIDELALYKMNVFHWHLTDDQGWRIEIKHYPKLTQVGAWRDGTLIGHYSDQPVKYDSLRYGGFYTQDDIKEIVAYATQRHITIVPEIEMPGHSLAMLASYPELGCTPGPFKVSQTWGVFDDVLCPKEETFHFLDTVLTEVAALFPGKYIHIGGDECPKTRWKESDFCQQLMKKEKLADENELQSWFVRRIEKMVEAKGKQIIGWDEILEGGLAPGAAVMSWRGEQGGIDAARQKHNVVMSPGGYCYFDHYQSQAPSEPLAIGGFLPLEKVYSFEPVPQELKADEQKYVLGAQANVWTEYIGNFQKVEYMAFPRICALSEVLWSPKAQRNYEQFTNRLVAHFFLLDRMGINYSKSIFELKADLRPAPRGDGVVLKLNAHIPHSVTRFTMDENPLTGFSPVFPDSMKINRPLQISAAIFEGPARRSPIWKQFYEISKSSGKPITLTHPPHANYNTGGAFTLTDGILGRLPWNGAEWLGWQGDSLNATIDLTLPMEIARIRVDALIDESSWIYQPKSVDVYVSSDSVSWTKLISMRGDDIQKFKRAIDLRFAKTTTRYVNIRVQGAGKIPDGKPGAGENAWLFIDELLID